ncbi:plasmid partitioning protein RepB [Bradyrhizobium sp. RT4b]|uniref:plasmid partitioning protein RepB n=1 Tax=Bradyrhizobium sp. RT4b TaxID=3156379 RepID=UPI0033913B79
MGRKNLLADLLDDKLTTVNEPGAADPGQDRRPHQPTLGSRGAVGAVSRSLEMLSAERDAAIALTEQLTTGQTVVEIDPALIDGSIVPDRMTSVDEKHSALVESIRANGQLVPILLRPHPTSPGRFQIAYGHRRVRALAELGDRARAVVRDLSDEDLVVAQGKENGEREDLSFIERATYAAALEDRGFKREIIMAALSVDKTELSRLISVTRALPRSLIDAIGPAQKTGRRRWMELVERIVGRHDQKALADTLASEGFVRASSDERFAIAFGALAPRKPKAPAPTSWSNDDGKKIVKIERREDRVTLALDERAAPAFGDFVISRLPELYRAFQEGRSDE